MFNIGIIELLIIVFFVVLFVKPKDIPLIIKEYRIILQKDRKVFQ